VTRKYLQQSATTGPINKGKGKFLRRWVEDKLKEASKCSKILLG